MGKVRTGRSGLALPDAAMRRLYSLARGAVVLHAPVCVRVLRPSIGPLRPTRFFPFSSLQLCLIIPFMFLSFFFLSFLPPFYFLTLKQFSSLVCNFYCQLISPICIYTLLVFLVARGNVYFLSKHFFHVQNILPLKMKHFNLYFRNKSQIQLQMYNMMVFQNKSFTMEQLIYSSETLRQNIPFYEI